MFSRISGFLRQAFRTTPRPQRNIGWPAPTARPVVPSSDGFSMPLPRPPVRLRSLGTGADEVAISRAMSVMPPAHVAAVQRTLGAGFHALVQRPDMLTGAGWGGVHLVHATYAPGTARSAMTLALPVGAYGVQLGAAQTVRGRNGHLHVYGAVYMPGVVR